MKVLLDENLPRKLKFRLAPHEVFTVGEMKWSGQKNGRLLKLMEDSGFQALIAADKNLSFQQNLPSQFWYSTCWIRRMKKCFGLCPNSRNY